jgi:hypothetical protein
MNANNTQQHNSDLSHIRGSSMLEGQGFATKKKRSMTQERKLFNLKSADTTMYGSAGFAMDNVGGLN